MMRGMGWLLAMHPLVGSSALAQVGEVLDYPELMRRADLVAIAEGESVRASLRWGMAGRRLGRGRTRRC